MGQSHYSYDPVGNLLGLVHADGLDNPLIEYVYGYNDADELISESHHGQDTTYVYDAIGQLAGADHTGQPDEQYNYDDSGNRAGSGYVITGGNRVTSDGTYVYEYDLEGNLVTKVHVASGNVTDYTYDHRNRLTGVAERAVDGTPLHSATFVYDVFDRRIAQTVDGAFTAFVHSGDRAWADFDASGNVLARYLYGEMATDHLLARQRPGESTVWYLGDRQGTVRDLADVNGVIINTISYDSFGNIVNETNPAAGDRFKYTGREFEAVFGLYYYRARWYDPQQGRFINEDTWGLAAGNPNFYRYVFNAPGQWTDPSGHLALTQFGAEVVLGALSAFLDGKRKGVGSRFQPFLGRPRGRSDDSKWKKTGQARDRHVYW